ncbi:MAG: hypothetical protein E3J72_20165 [Planctomycetota bacterium]|nr:MAG: hypothetical protein E3J72_20165 [Planctomycetota bacterium]
MRKSRVLLLIAALVATPLLFAGDEVEVSFADLIAKPGDYNGKTVKLSCAVVYHGSDKLAVGEVNLDADEKPYEGDAILLSGVKSSVKKQLAKVKFKKRTCYHGTAEIIGTVETGEFGKAKYKIKIKVTSMTAEGGGGSSSGGFKVLKKNYRTDKMASESQIDRQARGRKGTGDSRFNPPTYPKYGDGSGLAAGTVVLCLTNGKVSKAFPIDIMGCHELANIKFGKIPIAVSW